MPTFTANYNIPKPLVNNATDQDLWGGYLNSGMDIIDGQMKTSADAIAALQPIPIGASIDYWGTAAPTKWLLCFGQAISRTTYSALFTVLGTVYGSGDGSTTFNIPDCRGRVIAGQDDMGGTSANRLTGQSGGVDGDILGGVGGEEVHTLTIPEIPSHMHSVNIRQVPGSTVGVNTPVGCAEAATNTVNSGATGGGGAHNNVQPTIIANKIIYAGV